MINEQTLLEKLQEERNSIVGKQTQTKGVTKALHRAELQMLNKIEALIKSAASQPVSTVSTHWRTGDGELIPFGELTDAHLCSILKKCYKFRDSNERFKGVMAEVDNRWGHREVTLTDASKVGACKDAYRVCMLYFHRTKTSVSEVITVIPELELVNKEWADIAYKAIHHALNKF